MFVSVRLTSLRATARFLLASTLFSTLVLVAPAQAAFPGPNGRVTFVAGQQRENGRQGFPEIFTANPDGSAPLQLTHGPGYAGSIEPAWSPGGQKIAYVSDASPGIYLMNADGSGQTSLTSNGGDYSPAWSPDGRRIAFARSPCSGIVCFPPRIQVMNADGSGVAELAGPWLSNAAWSPDGKKIAFSRTFPEPESIVALNADGSGETRIATLPAGADSGGGPQWSPDGRKITFDFSYPFGSSSILTVNADGTHQRTVAEGGKSPAWSPDGRKIVFAFKSLDAFARPLARLTVMNADGSGKEPVLIGYGKLRGAAAPDWGTAPLRRDLAAPGLTVSARSRQRLKSALRHGVKVKVTCTEACDLKLKLLLARRSAKRLGFPAARKDTAIGAASREIQAGTAAKITVRVGAKAKRRLKRVGKLNLTLQVKATDGANNTRTRSRRIRFTR